MWLVEVVNANKELSVLKKFVLSTGFQRLKLSYLQNFILLKSV